MRRHYLQILGLPETASDQEIKKAYRRKAMLYHPDLNQSPGAQEQFVKIDKAYQYLMAEEEAASIPNQDFKSTNPIDDERRRNAAMYYQMAQELKKKQAVMYQRNIKRRMSKFRSNPLFDVAISFIAIVCMIYGGLFMVDQFLTPVEETFLAHKVQLGNDGFHYMYIDRAELVDIRIPKEVVHRLEYHRPPTVVDMELSPIFKTPISVFLVNNWSVHDRYVLNNVMYNWGFPIILLLPVFWLFYRKATEPMIVLANCLIIIYPIILSLHLYVSISFRIGILNNML